MSRDKPFVSIVVLNYNGKKWLKECFESLGGLEYHKDKYEVIMGDNRSTDDSVEYVKKNFPSVKVLQFDKNYGFCKGNNLCAKEAKGDYLVILNNDTFVDKKWLKDLINGISKDEKIISTVGKIFHPESKLIWSAGGVIFPDGCGLYTGYFTPESDKYNIPRYTGFGTGAGVLVEKKFFISTGGFDEYYFYTGEENDLGFRVWASGYKVKYIPSAVMHHYGGKTGSPDKYKTTPVMEFLVTRNKLYFIIKNFDLNNIIKGILLHMIRSFAMIMYAIIHKNIYTPIAILKAYVFVIKDIKTILKNRKIFQKTKIVKDSELYKHGIIVGVGEFFKIYIDAMRNAERNVTEGDIFSKKDAVNLKVENGEFVFVKPKNEPIK
ncbi:hypothetical protein MSIBF_A180005 [groundwater metagenome]|uniref:Glycosyltransferase 2-like domain-containing protein n=1 Tax=groundwater metagenome TaxID=717931 RepID=A0A098EAC6_9ZZZZ